MSAQEEAASRWLWACLSPYLDTPDMPATHEDWARIFKVADDGLVLPRLALTVAEDFKSAPQPVLEYLEIALAMSRLRNEQLREQLVTLIKSLNARGVVPIIMKGATTLLDESADIGARSMLDMDVWTPGADDQRLAVQCLTDLGYCMRDPMSAYEHSQHFPPFFKDGALSCIELHWAMVYPSYASLVNEEAAAAHSIERRTHGISYRILAADDALTLSYLQCRWSCDERSFTTMKWLDLVDRCRDVGLASVKGCADLGVAETGALIDAQFLTALSILSGLPYEGAKDAAFYDAWLQRNSSSVATRLLRSAFGSALDRSRWSEKSLADIWRGAVYRLKHLPQTYRQSKKLDRF